MKRISPTWKMKIADKILVYLANEKIMEWGNTRDFAWESSKKLNFETFDFWKGYELLITLGRIERNSPAGNKGAHVVSLTPLCQTLVPAKFVSQPKMIDVTLRDYYDHLVNQVANKR